MPIFDNRCPHAISLVDAQGRPRLIAQTGPAVRIETIPGPPVDCIDGIPVHAPPGWKCLNNLPPFRAGVVVVVSQIVALAVAALLPERCDIVYPGTGPKDGASRTHEKGVVAVTRLIRAV